MTASPIEPFVRLAMYQPDMPANLGNMLRLCACMGAPAELIEPAGFPVDEKRMKRAGMDYIDQVALSRHSSWDAFVRWRSEQATKPRLILLSAHAASHYAEFRYQPGDILMVGQESAGVPAHVADACDAAVLIPMAPNTRCLNVSSAAAIILSEALRQLRTPTDSPRI